MLFPGPFPPSFPPSVEINPENDPTTRMVMKITFFVTANSTSCLTPACNSWKKWFFFREPKCSRAIFPNFPDYFSKFLEFVNILPEKRREPASYVPTFSDFAVLAPSPLITSHIAQPDAMLSYATDHSMLCYATDPQSYCHRESSNDQSTALEQRAHDKWNSWRPTQHFWLVWLFIDFSFMSSRVEQYSTALQHTA